MTLWRSYEPNWLPITLNTGGQPRVGAANDPIGLPTILASTDPAGGGRRDGNGDGGDGGVGRVLTYGPVDLWWVGDVERGGRPATRRCGRSPARCCDRCGDDEGIDPRGDSRRLGSGGRLCANLRRRRPGARWAAVTTHF